MGKEEEKLACPAKKDKGKAPCLEPRDSVRGTVASQQDNVIDDTGSKECQDFIYDTKEMYEFLETIERMKDDPQCVDCRREATAGNLTPQEPKPRFVLCSGCSKFFCAGLASNEDGPMGHARPHAKSACHPVALWIGQPDAGYCFLCDHSLSLKVIALAAHSHKQGYVVRGLRNCHGKCFVNATLQCLLALDDLWISMLGPHAPAGSLGVALKELFMETRTGNDAGAVLNQQKLLQSIPELDEEYSTSKHQDCQEFLLHLRNRLIDEELLRRPPNMPKDFPTVVDSIFEGQVSTMWTYKPCLHTSDMKKEELYELSLSLPPKEHPTKSVPAPQSRGRRKKADAVKILREMRKQEEKKAASLPSIKQCLKHHFRKEVVEKRCEICKPSTSQSKDSGQMVTNISESKSPDTDQAERGHHGKVKEKSNLLSAHDNQNACTLNQDRTKQAELKNTAQQVGEDPSKQIDMGGPADKTLFLSKLPPVLTIHVLRFNVNDKRKGHVEFEEYLDLEEYLEPRSRDKDNARYRLVGVIEHQGRSLEGGHFVAYVRASRIVIGGPYSWFCANDTNISEISLEKVFECDAFLLFYEKIEA